MRGTIARLICGVATALFCFVASGTAAAQKPAPSNSNEARGASPAELFQRGQDALNQGKLEEAEHEFRAVLAIDRQSAGAYANLGVVYMRQKQWGRALSNLQRAEQLMPRVAGIRLNIGLVYFRQNEFLKAITPFESVVREQPDAVQPRYLLGLCYFFAERWADAASTLEPLWAQESGKFPYLYVLSNAAHRANRKELDERATSQLIKVGDGSPEYHLFVGKYHLNEGRYDEALKEFKAAETADAKLPFVHFNLGLTYVKQQEYEKARDEFLEDAKIEPDQALNYEQLGDLYWLMQQDENSEKSYRKAVQLNPQLVNSRIGLAKVYQRQQKYAQALTELDAAVKQDPARTDTHYLRGQTLVKLGRKDEAKKELAESLRIDNERRAEVEKRSEQPTVPSPELMADPQ